MNGKEFKIISTGACAYFLVMYSCLHFVLETWFSSSRIELLITAGFCMLMLLIGIVLLSRFRQAGKEKPDPGSEASSAISVSAAAPATAKLIGSFTILIVIAQLLIRQLSMSMMRFSPGAIWGNLFTLAFYAPFILAAVIQIRKGFRLKNGQPFDGSVSFLCGRVLLMYLFLKGIYYILLWLQPMIAMPEYSASTFDLFWNIMPLVSIVCALALYFAPLRVWNSVKDDGSVLKYLSAQSFIISGFLLLLNGIFELSDRVIPDVLRLISTFGRYGGESPYPIGLAGYAPALFLLIISGIMIIYGKKVFCIQKNGL